MNDNPIKTFTTGVLWEEMGAEIYQDFLMETKEQPCPHAHSPQLLKSTYYPWDKRIHWTIPLVLKAYNEGGYNSVGICLQCLKELEV